MTINTENNNHIVAEEGKVFQRISDGYIFGKEMFLGMTYYLNGTLLSEPLQELPEHFIEIDEPIIQEDTEENLVGDMVNSIIDTPYEEVK